MPSAYLLIDARGPEIQHRSGLTAPDSFIYLAEDGVNPIVFFDAREFQVMKTKLQKLDNGVQIEHLEPYQEKVTTTKGDSLVAVAVVIIKEKGIKEIKVSGLLPYSWGQQLEKSGLKVVIHNYAHERENKTDLEIKHMTSAQRVNESAFELAYKILSDSTVQRNAITYKNKVLTSEILKTKLRKHLLDKGYDCPDGLIVASGEQSAQPHNEGSGPLLQREPIIIDIFPRSQETGFFADMTRTFVKGKPSKKIRDLYSAVEEVQAKAVDSLALDKACSSVHKNTVQYFKDLKHETSYKQGFMHGTGHSLGLSVHEEPFLNSASTHKVKPGMAFTVEPGLYYPGLGGVRIEDVVIFHPDGKKENITKFNKPYIIP